MANGKEFDANHRDIVDNMLMTRLEIETAATELMELFNDRLANSVMNKDVVEIDPGNYMYQYTDKTDKQQVRWEIVTLKGTDVEKINIRRLTTEVPQADKKQIKEIDEMVFIQTGKNPSCMYTTDNLELMGKGVPQNTRFAIDKSREVIKAIPQIKSQKAPFR